MLRFLLFAVLFPGTPSPKLSASLLSWPSFLCLMFLSSGLFYFVTGSSCLSLQWDARSHTWSNINTFLSTLGSRWDSYGSNCFCLLGQISVEATVIGVAAKKNQMPSFHCQMSNFSSYWFWWLTNWLFFFDRDMVARSLLQVVAAPVGTEARLNLRLEEIWIYQMAQKKC